MHSAFSYDRRDPYTRLPIDTTHPTGVDPITSVHSSSINSDHNVSNNFSNENHLIRIDTLLKTKKHQIIILDGVCLSSNWENIQNNYVIATKASSFSKQCEIFLSNNFFSSNIARFSFM